MSDVCGALVRLEVLQQVSDAPPYGFDRPFLGFPDQGFELCEHHLNGVEIRTVGRQEEQMGADIPYGVACRGSFVTAQVVENDDIARRQGGHQELLDPGRKHGPVDRPIQDQRSHDPVVTQACQEGQRLPMAVGNFGHVGLALCTPTPGAGHVGLHPGLVDEDQALGIDLMLVGFPARSEASQLRPILLLGQQRFF